MKRLQIPQTEKDKGMIWVEYKLLEENVIVELKIQQEKN
jgi:hypothetical protein